jgi:hypothetical protein
MTDYELRYVDRIVALIQHERSVAAALRRFHLRSTASQHAPDKRPSSPAGIGGRHIRGSREGPSVRGVAEPETGSPGESGAETAAPFPRPRGRR